MLSDYLPVFILCLVFHLCEQIAKDSFIIITSAHPFADFGELQRFEILVFLNCLL